MRPKYAKTEAGIRAYINNYFLEQVVPTRVVPDQNKSFHDLRMGYTQRRELIRAACEYYKVPTPPGMIDVLIGPEELITYIFLKHL